MSLILARSRTKSFFNKLQELQRLGAEMKKTFVSMLLLFLLHQLSFAQGQISVARERVLTKEGEAAPTSIELFPIESGIGKVKVKPIDVENASSLQLHFRIQSAPANPTWAIQVKDATGRVASIISASMVSGNDFWSDEIPGKTATVEIISIAEEDPARRLEIKIIEIIKGIPPITPEAITPPNQLETIAGQSSAVKILGRAVARLRFKGDDGSRYRCTAFLISRDLLLTNNHCIRTDSERGSAFVDFDYDDAGSNQTSARLKELVLTNPELDFTILRLMSPVSTDRGFLILASVKPAADQSLLIIQHPSGEPKQVSRQDCIVDNPTIIGVSPQPTDFSHKCDTKGGSSGAPVFDSTAQDAKVVGLHHLGFDERSQFLVNRAVRIGLIIDFIRSQKPSLLSELGIP
jgi:hypothetical protein